MQMSSTTRRILFLLCISSVSCIVLVCNKASSNKKTISFWHFWSEPAQKQALYKLIDEFEKEHPDIDINPVELQWSDGKSKLQLAFAGGAAPDVAHIGLEWVHQFAEAGVLRSLDSSLFRDTPHALLPSVRQEGEYVALPWVMNTRALFLHKAILEHLRSIDIPPFERPADFYSFCSYYARDVLHMEGIGINAYEPHNVSKKVLPLLWAEGSSLFTTLPFSSSFDSAATEGLAAYCRLAQEGGTIESSRALDERMRRGEIGLWISGMWMLGDSSVNAQYAVLSTFHANYNYLHSNSAGRSILSGDCYTISSHCSYPAEATLFLAWLSKYSTEYRFCMEVPDAGIPAHLQAKNDTRLAFTHNRSAFIQQIFISRVLPAPSYYLDAEQVLENEVMEAVYGKKSPADAMNSARQRIQRLEQLQKSHSSPT